ncbi:MAG TPA: UvrD-helicase domain-containing protein, partial [Clostridia bacterium]|nr:UvrD-helicase domain-containing protein [Clostridia bacterium]
MTEMRLSDAAARERIERDLDTNFLVEAGAGSGKTASMVKRMVALITSGKYTVDQIVAITFTRKAAAELRQRFQNQLEKEFREKPQNTKEAGFLDAAMKNIDSCFIGTIHSFCGRILRERPVEAGLDLNFQELDDLENLLMERKAWEEYLQEIKVSNPRSLVELNNLGISPEDLASCFSTLCLFPDVQPVYSRVEKPDLTDALEAVKIFVYKAGNLMPADEPAKGYDNLQEQIKKASRYLSFFDLSRDVNIIKILSGFDRNLKVTQNRWPDRDDAKECQHNFEILREDVIQPALRKWREYVHYRLMLFLLPGVEYAERYRSRLSCL